MLIDTIKNIEFKSSPERFEFIIEYLEQNSIKYEIFKYSSGKNIITYSRKRFYIGIGAHYDVYQSSPGANDNASAIAVALDAIKYFNNKPLSNIGVKFFCFDEEEKGMLGSKAFTKEGNFSGLLGFINMEMVGKGENYIVWDITEQEDLFLVRILEDICILRGFPITRVGKMFMNSSDHMSFRRNNVKEAFTLTCVSNKDYKLYNEWLNEKSDSFEIREYRELLTKLDIFKKYHNSYDTSNYLSEECLKNTSIVLIDTISKIDKLNTFVRSRLYLDSILNFLFK